MSKRTAIEIGRAALGRIGPLALFTLAVAAPGLCTGSCSESLSQSITSKVRSGVGTTIPMTELAPFYWERVCVFGPYTPDHRIDEITGVRGAASAAFDLQSNDGIDVLMFLRAGRVVSSVAHRRSDGDFGQPHAARVIHHKCFQRAGHHRGVGLAL
jgi:hypothetical protein